jgi:hypothetical protein
MSTYITRRAKDLGLRKVDARSPLVLGVTVADIRFAQQKNPECCALARAACREYRGVRYAYFFRSTAWLEYPDRLVRYVLPTEVQRAIATFDRTSTMEPGAYRLLRPVKSLAMGAIRKRSEARPGRHQPGDGKIKRKVIHRADDVRSLFQPKLLGLPEVSA